MVDTYLELGRTKMTAWIVLGMVPIVLMVFELLEVPKALSLGTLAAGLAILMVLFSQPHAVLPMYEHLLAPHQAIVIYQELVLGTALGLTGVLAPHQDRLASTLLMMATAGGVAAVSTNNWLMLFLGIETVNVGLYGLAGHWSWTRIGDEALIKYFILGSLFTAAEVAGIGLIGGIQGNLTIGPSTTGHSVLIAGLTLMFSALLFKMGSFPFHLWAPDTYEGTAWPATTVIATLPKIVAGSVLIRLTTSGVFNALPHLTQGLETIAVGTMIVGSLGAWRQRRLKRMLAYAAIAQVGYILLPLSSRHMGAASVYLLSYALTSIAVFGAASALSGSANPTRLDLVGVLDTGGRWFAATLIVALAGFAGFPFTLGMAAKLYSIEAVMHDSPVLWLTALLVTGFTFLYYFRWIYPFFAQSPKTDDSTVSPGINTSQLFALLIVGLGIWSYPLAWLTQNFL